MIRPTPLVWLALALLPAASLGAQEYTPAESTRVLAPGGGLFRAWIMDAKGGPGGVWAFTSGHDGVLRFDAETATFERVVGDEDRHPHLRAFDVGAEGSVTWFDPDSLTIERADRFYRPERLGRLDFRVISLAAPDDSTVVVSGRRTDGGHFTQPLHRIRNGVVQSFGYNADLDRRPTGSQLRLLSRVEGGRLAAVAPESNVVEIYDADLQLERVLTYDAPWAQGGDEYGTPDQAPDPRAEMVQAADGGLWIVGRVASREWERFWDDVELDHTGAFPAELYYPTRLFDYWVLRLDLESGEVVERRYVDHNPVAVLDDRRILIQRRVSAHHSEVELLTFR